MKDTENNGDKILIFRSNDESSIRLRINRQERMLLEERPSKTAISAIDMLRNHTEVLEMIAIDMKGLRMRVLEPFIEYNIDMAARLRMYLRD